MQLISTTRYLPIQHNIPIPRSTYVRPPPIDLVQAARDLAQECEMVARNKMKRSLSKMKKTNTKDRLGVRFYIYYHNKYKKHTKTYTEAKKWHNEVKEKYARMGYPQ